MMNDRDELAGPNEDQLITQANENALEILKSTSISVRNKSDSGYSSFISQRNIIFRTSSPIVTQHNNNNNKVDSPGTSYSSRNSALINDEELEEMFPIFGNFLPIEKTVEKIKDTPIYLLRDLDYSPEMMTIRHSIRNSPWTTRPDSAPLNEEDEDSDKEAHYSCSLPQEFSNTGPLVTLSRRRRYSMIDESEHRKELIASKLREIADKMETSNKIRTRRSSENIKPSSRRHSHSSFADIVPCGCGSAMDLILSLYNVYKMHSKESVPTMIATSQSMANMTVKPQRTNSRSRSYTE